jgi:hypothetical protein
MAIRTMRERGWDGINAIQDPAVRADVREYVLYLERQRQQARDEASRLRYPDTTGQ